MPEPIVVANGQIVLVTLTKIKEKNLTAVIGNFVWVWIISSALVLLSEKDSFTKQIFFFLVAYHLTKAINESDHNHGTHEFE